MKSILTVLLFVCSTLAFAQHKFAIFTDQPGGAKAQEIIRYMKTTPPMNQFDIEFEILQRSSNHLDCKSQNGIDRLIVCDSNKLLREASRLGFDEVFAVADSNKHGGSGGSISVISSSDQTPVDTILHEYMHVLGFGDEYEYSASEAVHYCDESEVNSHLNLVAIKPRDGGYANDSDARSYHSRSIPWFSLIKGNVPITNSNRLGTPGFYGNEIGLFEAGTCKQSRTLKYVWRAGNNKNIMSHLGAPIGNLEKLLEKALLAKGLRKKTIAAEPKSNRIIKREPIERRIDTTTPGVFGKIASKDPKKNRVPQTLKARIESQRTVIIRPVDITNAETPDNAQKEEPKNTELKVKRAQEEKNEDETKTLAIDEASPDKKLALTTTSEDKPEEDDEIEKNVEKSARTEAEPSSCNSIIDKLLKSPKNKTLKDEYMKLQGKITLHRLAWLQLKKASKETDSLEQDIVALMKKRDPELHASFIESKRDITNKDLELSIQELKKMSEALVDDPKKSAYVLQYSDIKMIQLLVEAEEFHGSSLRDGVMSYPEIIKNTLKSKNLDKEESLIAFEDTINQLEKKKAVFESTLQEFLGETECYINESDGTCRVVDTSEQEIQGLLKSSENLVNYIYDTSAQKEDELKNLFQWNTYWLETESN